MAQSPYGGPLEVVLGVRSLVHSTDLNQPKIPSIGLDGAPAK